MLFQFEVVFICINKQFQLLSVLDKIYKHGLRDSIKFCQQNKKNKLIVNREGIQIKRAQISQIYKKINNKNILMFFLVRNLKTNLHFTPHDMDKLHSQSTIVQILRQKVQGLCFNQYGFIVKIAKDQSAYSQQIEDEIQQTNNYIKAEQGNNEQNIGKKRDVKYYLISAPQVDENGIKVSVIFSAICFKAQKNDLIQFKVQSVCQDFVKGLIGPVQVKLPRTLIQGFEYKKDENIFISRSGGQNKIVKIDKGTKIKAICISTSVQFNVNMKIVVGINKILADFIENDYK